MLFAFRSADGRKYPRFLNMQTWDLPLTEKDLARMMAEGRAKYDAATGNIDVMVERERPKVQVIGSASEWPDVIGSEGWVEQPIIVSDRVVTDLDGNGITGYNAKAVEITKKAGRNLKVAEAPRYFVLEVSGRIRGHVDSWVRAADVPADQAEKLNGAWDGCDLFVEEKAAAGRWALFCSDKVFELARAEGWTNCGFQPLHCFGPFHKRLYLEHETALPLEELVERYRRRLK